MKKTKSTIQNGITSILVFSSVLFIAAFTFIQINNQTSSISRYNSYQANLSSAILKSNLDSLLQVTSGEEISTLFQSTITELQEADIIKDVVVFDSEGNILAGTMKWQKGDKINYRDLNKLDELQNLDQQNKRFLTTLASDKNILQIYVSFKKSGNDKIYAVAKLGFPLYNINEALSAVYKPILATIAFVILANLLLGYLLSQMVVGPIKILNQVTKTVASGDLSIRSSISTGDELQELGETFNYMTEELIKMKERAENANPLTKLPGNIVIHEEIDTRIKALLKFTVIYCDLDNFKAFNDKYGIAKGDEAIKLAADIFKEAVKSKGTSSDFIGHEGGDDFILVIAPEKSEEIANYIIDQFDKRVRELYPEEDLSQGRIIAHGRDGSIKEFPIMTISLGGVTNETREISSYQQITNIAAEVKKKAKSFVGKSIFILDKRIS